ncbi:MAG: choice-of-anchor D domain-containing protein [Acidobacteriaceae bacterium]|nr:choice-of-anchor D domain-containing protein [Acidobacteriaceae bacterium]
MAEFCEAVRLRAFLGVLLLLGLVSASVQGASLSAAWTAVGPAQIASQRYGTVSGRVTAVAIDPVDSTGNTVYVGTTGGGVWKSTNAAGLAASVTFAPLTDTLSVFSANAGTAVMPSLTIGALSVSQASGLDVILAGTGDPNDAADSYYGEGILRSTDGGVTWTLVQQSSDSPAANHSFVGLSVAGFAWSSASPGLVVAALSQSEEGVLVNAPNTSYSVMGLYYSADAGVTWQMATIKDGSQTVQQASSAAYPGNAATAVVWNPVRQMFYAAVRYHGYYQSSDGVAWTRLANQPGTGLSTTACPTNPNATGSSACPIFRGALAVQPTTGDTFALTVDANNLDQGLWQDVCGLSGSNCVQSPIAFGSHLNSTALEVGSGGAPTTIAQGDYNLSLAAVATGTGSSADTLLFAGTMDLYRCSLAAGCAVLRNTTNANNGCTNPAMVSPSQHAIATLAGAGMGNTPALVYVGNDGGLWRSLDGVDQQQAACSSDDANHFQNLNGGLGSLAEVVSFAQHPSDPATLLAGLGANGTVGTGAAAATAAWPQIAAGEGGTVAIDQSTPQNWYVSTESGVSLRTCGSGSSCAAANFAGSPTIGYAQVDSDASLIYEPFLLDPALTSEVLIGTCRVWRGLAESGAGWPGSSNISTMFAGPQNAACNATNNAMVRSLAAGGPASGVSAVQNAGSTVLYAGMAGTYDGGSSVPGHLFANYAAGGANSNSTWTDVAKSTVSNVTGGVFNPGGFDLSSVVVDAHDATGMTVYATVEGFSGNGVNAAHVYRSTNGGASWANISSNLPNSPANGLVVDPNDANTLYVAMDAGVYATTAVTTCATATVNCWGVYGTSLPNAPIVSLAAAAKMATGDGRFGELRAATYGRGIWQIPLLTAAYPAAPAMTLNPTSLSFAAQAVATASAAQAITVTNSGNASLSIASLATSGDFSETDNCVGSAIAVNASCTVQVKFLPAQTGARTGLLTIYGNVAGGQATVALSGVGTTAASIALSPITLTFATTNVGATSAAQSIAISNTGGLPATLQTPTITGDFLLSANTCGTTLAANSGCTVSIEFQPTASGTRTGFFSIADSVGTQTASLSGVAQLPATDALTPLALTFAAQQLNTTSATQQVTLTNSGDVALTLISAVIASGDFSVVNGCGSSLIGHSSCSLVVTFIPKNIGAETGVLAVSDTYRSQTVTLSGTGVAPAGVSLAPVSTLAFAATGVGLRSPAQTATLTNNGGMPLTIQSITTTGDFAIVAGGNTCGTSLSVGAACTVQIVFAPTATAARAGTFTVTNNAASSPQSLQLTGTGVDFALAANGSPTATISPGSNAVYPLLLSSAAGVPGMTIFTCAPIPAHATCVVNPATATLGATTPITVTVATSVAGAELLWPEIPGKSPLVWLALLLPVGLFGMGRRRILRVSAFVALCCVLAVAGCGNSRMIPQSTSGGGGTTPTPSGTYNFVVSATSTGLTRSVNLTLIVQ